MNNISKAAKKRWAKVPKADRKALMRRAALIKHKKLTTEERSAAGKKMVLARWKKYYDNKKLSTDNPQI